MSHDKDLGDLEKDLEMMNKSVEALALQIALMRVSMELSIQYISNHFRSKRDEHINQSKNPKNEIVLSEEKKAFLKGIGAVELYWPMKYYEPLTNSYYSEEYLDETPLEEIVAGYQRNFHNKRTE